MKSKETDRYIMRYQKGAYDLNSHRYFLLKNLPNGEKNFEGSGFLRYYVMSISKM